MTRAELAKLVGRNISVERLARNHSQGWLAQKVGLPRESLSRIENGRHSARLDQLVIIADALGCTLDALLVGLLDTAGVAA